jgi:hypothetical protein
MVLVRTHRLNSVLRRCSYVATSGAKAARDRIKKRRWYCAYYTA